MSDQDSKQRIVDDLTVQLHASREQEQRLKDVLSRVLKLIDDGETP
jgi:hypothetical protein